MTKVLLVEDDDIISSLMKDLLKDKGFTVTHVDDGSKALETLKETTEFDIILMDEKLKTMNGSEALVKIRANPNTSRIPIIMLTSLDDEEFQANVLNEGADDFLRKPFRMNILLARINSVLRRAQSAPALEIEVPEGADPSALNEREIDILRSIVKGSNNQTIAEELFLSEATVANYIKSIFAKLKTSNRTQAAILAIKLNLV